MKLITAFPGENHPFEGNRTVILKGLPAGALIEEARLTIRPVAAPGRALFSELLTFANGQEPFGGTKVSAAGFVEVDFHARRTLAAVNGSNLGNSELLVDLGGGVFMEINERGAIAAPDDGVGLFTLPGSNALLPGLTVQKFRLRRDVATVLNVSQARVHSVPSNVSVALDEQPPFWTHTGELTGQQSSTDFATFLQSYLEEAELVDGVYHIPLLIHSDTLARLTMEVEIEYSVQQSALPAGLNEVALDYGYNATPQDGQEWLQVIIPAGSEVTAASVSVNGAFDDSRIVAGPKGPVAPAAEIAITAGQGQAQPIVLAQDTAVTAVDLLLSSTTRAALLDINVLADAGGKPVGDPLLPTPAQVALDRDLAAEPTWISVRLPQEFQFAAGKRYWLVVQVREGEAAWHAVPANTESESLRHAVASGLAWRLTPVPAGSTSNGNGSNGNGGTVAGLYRLRHTPAAFEMPLEVQVGEGAEAVTVSLDRFQPQGNINFTIDFPEFVDAINEVARRSAPAVCAQGEQLQNGPFEQWSVDPRRPADAQPHTVGEGQAFAMQVAPNGRWFIAAFPDQERSEFWSLPCHTLEGTTPVTPRSQQHLAISADSLRIYIAGQYGSGPEGLFILDAETRQPIGEALYELENEIPPIRALALHPDGKRLYLALEANSDIQAQVIVVDTALLEERLSSGESFDLDDVLALPDPLELPAGQQVTSLAVSPAGQQLFMALSAFEQGQTDFGLRVYSADTLQPQAPLADNTAVRVVTITPNGKWALLLDDFANVLHVVDLARQTLTTISLPGNDMAPAAIAVAPDSSRAFVTSSAAGSLISVDLQRLTATLLLPPGSLNTEIQAFPLAITPQGDRLYLTLPPQNDLFLWGYLPLQHHRPDHWALTAGFVRPVCLAEPAGLAALLGPVGEAENALRPRRPSTLSQVVAATGGCIYELSFWGISNGEGAVAEVIWRGEGCTLQRTDRIPIEAAEPVNTFSQANAARRSLEATVAGLAGLRRHRARLEAPAGTTQAEIRFLVPAGRNALLDSVSFQGSLEQVANHDFQQDEAGELLGWQMEATGAALTLLPAGDQVLLQNGGPTPAVLRQEVVTPAGQPFELVLAGRIQAQSQPQTAHVELAWQEAGGSPAGVPTVLAVDSSDTLFSRKGSVPAAATHATLHLVIPPFTTLAVSRVSLVFLQIVTVPVAFIAQAPGELFVSDFHITYDVPAVSTPPRPAGGFCQPTPPGRESGTDDCTGCDDCDDCDEEWMSSPAPQPAVQTTPISAPLRQTRPAVLAHVAPARAPVLAPVAPAATLPLTLIAGISDNRAAVLTSLGIDTLPKLARAEAAVIARVLRNVGEAGALDFIRQAQEILGKRVRE